MQSVSPAHPFPTLRVFLAGMAGGVAEIVWVGLYCTVSPLTGAEVSREVTAAVIPALAPGSTGVALGIVIHQVLAVALAFVFAWVVWRPWTSRGPALGNLIVGAAVLSAVWAMNFFVIVPMLNERFVTLMPHPVTLASKILFGLSMGAVLGALHQRAGRGVARTLRQG